MRARNIKPGFYRDAKLAKCSVEARYIIPGLWMMADRDGKLKDDPDQIKMELFPCDDWDCEKLLHELAEANHIIRYEVDGLKVIKIRKFLDHQNPHKNEIPSILPDYSGEIENRSEHSGNGASTPADSLIPDSLIPDSLIPDSLTPETSFCRSDESEPTEAPTKHKSKSAKINNYPVNEIVSVYHDILGDKLPPVKLTEDGKPMSANLCKHIGARCKERAVFRNIDFWKTLFVDIRDNMPFLIGQNKTGWRASLFWIIGPENFGKILSGNYYQHGPNTGSSLTDSNLRAVQSFIEKMEARKDLQ